jgi:hypothetical protein
VAVLLRLARHDVEKESAHAAEQARPDILSRRWDWFESQPDLDPTELVFIDETWASTNTARTRGRAPAASGCAPPSRMATGRPRPLWLPCATPAWWRRWCWTGR